MKTEVKAGKPSALPKSGISSFLRHHYRHFNAASLIDAADAYKRHLDGSGKMLVSLAGAMSTAELGLSLAEMIRRDKVHIISCTGANLEEDVYNLIAHDFYERIPNYRDLTPQEEKTLLDRHLNRVTDTCIPEEEAMRRLEKAMLDVWTNADKSGERYFPHEFIMRVIRSGVLEKHYQIDPKDSWLVAAAEKNIPVVVPGWEDSTLGNMFAAAVIRGDIKKATTMRSGIEYMVDLAAWYQSTAAKSSIGFFQIGGGIAGDFPICVVPMIHQDLQREAPRVGLLLSDQRLDHELRFVLGCRSQREDHLGQARRRHTQVHRRIRCHHRGTADVRDRPRLVSMKRILAIAWVPLLLVVASCQGSGDLPLDQIDAGAVSANPTFDQVNAIMQRACATCHGGEGEGGGDYPEGAAQVTSSSAALGGSAEPGLRTCLEIVEQRESIWETAVANTMPPGALPRLTSEEKLIIRRWIDNGAPAPCN